MALAQASVSHAVNVVQTEAGIKRGPGDIQR